MKCLWRWVFLVVLLLNGVLAKADLLSATLDYHGGQFERAYDEFTRLAQLGNKDAIYNIAVMHLHGQGVSKDLVQAHAWFLLAADFGVDEARAAAKLIEQQHQQPQRLSAAYQQLSGDLDRSAVNHRLVPQFSAQQYNQVSPPARIHTVAAKYPKQALESGLEGWVWLEFDVAASGVVKDVDIIDAYPDKTFNRSIYNALRRWRFALYQRDGKKLDYRNRSLTHHFTTLKGKRYKASFSRQKKQYQQDINRLIERAEQGSASVQYHIANWLLADEHNATRLLRFHWPQDNAGFELLLTSAVNGFANAQYRLGVNLLRGEYAKVDRVKGLNWIRHAAEQGFVHAQYRLATELFDHNLSQFDAKAAQHWLTLAAEQGHFRAIRDLLALLIEQEAFTRAHNYLKIALEKDDEHPDILRAQGHILASEGKQKDAQDYFAQALKEAQARGW